MVGAGKGKTANTWRIKMAGKKKGLFSRLADKLDDNLKKKAKKKKCCCCEDNRDKEC
jgi:hypothetical protein